MKRIVFLLLISFVSLALLVTFLSSHHEGIKQANTHSGMQPPRPMRICLAKTDFSAEMPGVNLSLTTPESLMPLHEPLVLHPTAIGGGWCLGPVSEKANDWYTLIRYIVYATSEDAKANWRKEDARARAYTPGSFHGAIIGDDCGHILDETLGWAELHVVRSNVSVNIKANIRTLRDDKTRNRLVRQVLEMSAKAIVKRIDAAMVVNGKVDLTNLLPIRPRNTEPTQAK